MQSTEVLSWLAIGISLLSLGLHLWRGTIAKKSSNSSSVSMHLSIRQDLRSTEKDMVEEKLKFEQAENNCVSDPSNTEFKDALEIRRKMLDFTVEAHCNVIDVICTSVMKKNLDENEVRKEYGEAITNVVKLWPSKYGAGTSYTSTVDLVHKWKRM